MTTRTSLLLVFALTLAACAKHERAPLPGDTVSEDGAITLTPSRPSTAPRLTSDDRRRGEPLGAIEARVFTPELVMDHQAAIGLRPEQKDAIQKEVDKGQRDMQKLQWELSKDKEKLALALDQPKVDEAKANETAAELMKKENAIKTAHLSMLIRVKNQLDPAQQAKLKELRDGAPCAAAPAADAGK
jgi:hypothetical protein